MKPLFTESSFDFGGRRVLITGAAGGLGSAISNAFAGHGAELLLADRDGAGLTKVSEAISTKTSFKTYDQADLQSVAALAQWAGQVDVLVNNAGILSVGPIIDTDPETIELVVQTNLTGPMVIARHVALGMLEQGRGIIVNVSSQLAFHGAATRAAYSAAKAGLAQFTRAAAVEWAPHGVRVLGIAPGRTRTPMTADFFTEPGALEAALEQIPAGRLGEPDDVARMVLFLASDSADYVVGETVIADGGYVLL